MHKVEVWKMYFYKINSALYFVGDIPHSFLNAFVKYVVSLKPDRLDISPTERLLFCKSSLAFCIFDFWIYSFGDIPKCSLNVLSVRCLHPIL